jgi:hypothetical protein
MPRFKLLPALGAAVLVACSDPVTPPPNDSTPPTVELGLIANGEERAKVLSGGTPETGHVLVREKGVFLANAEDAGGVKELALEVRSGGKVRQGGGSPAAARVSKSRPRESARDAMLIGGSPVYAEEGGALEIVAVAEDYNGNTATTAPMTVDQLTEATADLQVSPNPITRGDSANLSWRVRGQNVARTEVTQGAGRSVPGIPTPTGRGGSQSVDPTSSTTYTLRVTPILNQPTSPGDTVRLQVQAPTPPQISLSARQTNVRAGTSVTFDYDAQNVDQVEIPKLNLSPTRTLRDSVTQTLNTGGTFSATAYGLENGSRVVTAPETVQVSQPTTVTLQRSSLKRANPNHKTSTCGQTQSSIELRTRDVTKSFGTYAIVDGLEVRENTYFDARQSNVSITHHKGSGGTSSDGVGKFAGGFQGTTTNHFNGEDARGIWCFNLNSASEPQDLASLTVVFTLRQ